MIEATVGPQVSRFAQITMRTVLRSLPGSLLDRISHDVQTMPDYRA